MPRVSILMPCPPGRSWRFFATASKSLRAQSESDWELLRAAPSSPPSQDPRDRVIDVAATETLGAGLADLLPHARAPWVAWMFPEDALAPTAMAQTLEMAQSRVPTPGLVYTDHRLVDERGVLFGSGPPHDDDPLTPLTRPVMGPWQVFHAQTLRDLGGFRPEAGDAADWDAALRVAERAPAVRLPQALIALRQLDQPPDQARALARIDAATRVITEALARRGLTDRWAIDVEVMGRFSILPRPSGRQNRTSAPSE